MQCMCKVAHNIFYCYWLLGGSGCPTECCCRAVQAKPAPPELPAAKNYLQETVQLLGRCRHDEIEMLERLSGFKKLIMVYRAVRAMKFVEFTRADLEQRKQKAEALAQQVYPTNRR